MKRILRPLTMAAALAMVCLAAGPAAATVAQPAAMAAGAEYTGHGAGPTGQEAMNRAVGDAATRARNAGENVEKDCLFITRYSLMPTGKGSWEATATIGCRAF